MEKGYISGEEYQAMQHPSHKQHPMQRMFKLPVVIAGLVLVLLIGLMAGWLGGVAHQKSIDNKLTSTGTQQPGSGGNGSVMCASGQSCAGSRGIMCSSGSGGVCTSNAGPIIGTVTAVTSSSITVQPSGGSAKTFAITSQTGFGGSNGGSLATYVSGDVQVGQTVGVVASSSSSSDAQVIILNPQAQTTQSP
jgi:hypothetical protein